MYKRAIIPFLVLFLSFSFSFSQTNQSLNYYDGLWGFYNGYSAVDQNGKVGIINSKMKLIIPCVYDNLNTPDLSPYFFYGLVALKKGNNWGAIDTTGKIIVPFKYDDLSIFFNEGISIARIGNKYGCINYEGENTLPFIYDDIGFINNGLRYIKLNNRVGYIDSLNHPIIPFLYDDGREYSENLIAVKKNGKWGYIDIKDSVIIPFMYDSATNFSDSLAAVSLNYKSGFIDKYNHVVIPFLYDVGNYNFDHGYARLEKEGKVGYINKKDSVIIPFEYEEGSMDYYQGYFIVSKSIPAGKWPKQSYGLFDSTGKQITDFIYEEMYYDTKNRFSVKQNHLCGIIDNTGKIIIPLKYDHILPGRFGLYTATLNNSLGYIDSSGNTIIPFIYDNADPFRAIFSDTVAAVLYQGICRVIDFNGKFVDNFNPNQQIKIYYENDSLSASGEIKDFHKNGKWNYYYSDGNRKETVNYKMGLKNGTDEVWDKTGTPESIDYYKNDMLNGKCTAYDSLGNVFYSNLYKNNIIVKHYDWKPPKVKSLPDISFFHNGKVRTYGVYNSYHQPVGKWLQGYLDDDSSYFYETGSYNSNFVKSGKWKHYNSNGKLLFIERFKNGDVQYPNGITTVLNVFGRPYQKGKILNGKKDSTWITFYNTALFSKRNYFMGELLGVDTEYSGPDTLTSTGSYALIELINDTSYKIILKKDDYKDTMKNFTSTEYGEWCYFYPDGKIKEKGAYSFKAITQHEIDSLTALLNYRDTLINDSRYLPFHIKSGVWTEYYENGLIKSTGSYYPIEFMHNTTTKLFKELNGNNITTTINASATMDSFKDKEWKYYSEDGKLIRDEIYKNTKLISAKTY